MTTQTKSWSKWIPPLVVLIVLTIAGVRYKTELAEWFGPVVGTITGSDFGAAKASDRTQAGPFDIRVQWEPAVPKVGENTLALEVRDTSGALLEGASVRVKVDDFIPLEEAGPGVYRAGVSLPTAGEWSIMGDVRTVDLRHADFVMELTTGEDAISIVSAGDGPVGDIAYWTCAMHPSVRSEGPGTCPICAMDLTPVTREEVETGVIMVDAQRRQLIGVKTDTVRREDVSKTIRAVGTVMTDETSVEDVTLKFRAWIGEADADFTGKFVTKGERLFTFYSPELWSAQEEYIEAVLRAQENPTRNNRLAEVAETRLRLWGLGPETIAAIRENGKPVEYLPYLSPATGTIMEKHVFDGSAVDAGQLLYRIADLSSLWVEADVYESELPLVHVGESVQITLPYIPSKTFDGTISYIYPYLNDDTRTTRVRIEVPNPDGALKPSMYANVHLNIPLGERLVVPESAILYAGESRVAFVDLGEGRLQPRTVETGVRTAGWIEIRAGLEEGEVVVTSANFLIAAESKLKSGIDKW